MTGMREAAKSPALIELIDTCDTIGRHLLGADVDDRLAASYPFLTMCSVAVCGWLMERSLMAATGCNTPFLRLKTAAARFYLDQIVPEALGLKAAATASADVLYSVDADTLAA